MTGQELYMCKPSRSIRDTLVGMFCYVSSDDFVFDRNSFHSFFRQQKDIHPGLLGDVTFLNRIDGYWSPWLQEAFEQVRIAGVIERKYGGFQNIDVFTVRMPPRIRHQRRRDLSCSELEELALDFQREFSI